MIFMRIHDYFLLFLFVLAHQLATLMIVYLFTDMLFIEHQSRAIFDKK